MIPVRKRLRLSPSSSAVDSAHSLRSTRPGPHRHSHDALLPRPSAVGGPEQNDNEEEEYLLVEEDTTDSSLIITMEDSQVEVKVGKKKAVRKKIKRPTEEEEEGGASDSEEEESRVQIDRQLDQSLETKSKQHNLTSVNVRNIIHEVITNEHVVAMMKAAINETEAVPPFEPKMTRSKFKEVVEKGVVIPAWNISPIKKTSDVNKAPQFVDIPLAEEDSSDEEYRPDEDDEDETAEDTFQESDMESTASSPRGSRINRVDEDSCSPWQISRSRSRRRRVGSSSMGPPPPPKSPPLKVVTDSSFLEKLHAVEEELAVCMEPYQPLSEEDEVGLMAYRTRSKRPLRDVPLGRLEAELRAPDITPDMYDSSSTHEDREWTDWLRGLMTSDMDNEEECDDEDDPEYNFLADIDEPDQEDYRDDKAVRITKKEVNELMEELFQTLKEDLAGQEVEDEGHEEEEEQQEDTHTVQKHIPEEDQHKVPSADDQAEDGPITELRTVKQQLEFLRRRRPHTHSDTQMHTHSSEPYTLRLDRRQRSRLRQQLQQHVQLLTQIHLLSSPVAKLQSEAETTKQFLVELDVLAQRAELLMCCCSVFRASNLQGALQLLDELQQSPISYEPQHHPPDARGHMRCYPVMPAELAWIFATRPVFLYPELLPSVSLDPALYCPRRTAAFTAAEDCLLVLGLRNMDGSCDPTRLVSQFLLRKTLVQVRRRILQCCRPGFPDNMIKAFRYQRVLWPMLVACRHVDPAERRPPVEREESILPLWLQRSLPVVYSIIKQLNRPSSPAPEAPPPSRSGGDHPSLTRLHSSSSYSIPPGTKYPPRLPKNLDFRRIGFHLLQHPLTPSSVPSPRLVLRRLFLSRNDITASSSSDSMTTIERIRCHHQTLSSLRRRRSHDPGGSASSQGKVQASDNVISISEEEREGDREQGEEHTLAPADDEEDLEPSSSTDEEEELFAQDFLLRVCEAVQVCPGVLEQLLQVLDQFSPLDSAELLFTRLTCLLRPWPRLLTDFAAFLNPTQARHCGLLVEQQLFERSRRFLKRLGQCLGEDSALYQQVVSVLQTSSAPPPEMLERVSALLTHRADSLEECWEFFQQLHASRSSPKQTDYVSQNSPDRNRNSTKDTNAGSNTEDQEEPRRPVCAKNVSMNSSGERVVVWTREADRTILMACQQRGANQRTFRHISAQLGNKTARQVSVRFHHLMTLFHQSTSCSSQPISTQEPPD